MGDNLPADGLVADRFELEAGQLIIKKLNLESMTKVRRAAPGLQLPSVTEIKLTNGLQALLINLSNSPVMGFDISFRAGDYRCPAGKPELAHFLEHLVCEATEDYPSPGEFTRAVRLNGGWFNASTTSTNVEYEFAAPDFDWQRVFDLALAAVSWPLFLPAGFSTEREVIRRELTRRLDSPPEVLRGEVLPQIGFSVLRTAERLAKLDAIGLADIKRYYRRTHGPNNARLLVAGHLPPARRRWIKRQLEQLSWSSDSVRRPPLPPEKLKGQGLIHVPDAKVEAVYYYLGFVNNRRSLNLVESDAMSIVEELLLAGLASRIYGRARQQGLVYAMGGEIDSTETSSHFDCEGEVGVDKLEPLIDLILAEIKRLLAGDLDPAELEQIKRWILGGFCLRRLTPGDWLDHYSGRYTEEDLVIPADFRSRLEAINCELVLELFRYVFRPRDWTLGLLGAVPAPLRRRLEAKLDRWCAELDI